jgi:hypothetical protein
MAVRLQAESCALAVFALLGCTWGLCGDVLAQPLQTCSIFTVTPLMITQQYDVYETQMETKETRLTRRLHWSHRHDQ